MIKENKSLVSHRDNKNLRCKLKFQVSEFREDCYNSKLQYWEYLGFLAVLYTDNGKYALFSPQYSYFQVDNISTDCDIDASPHDDQHSRQLGIQNGWKIFPNLEHLAQTHM